ncbi:hypothetical protein [Pseudidiomarina sp.]|uniref:hypothetical protein n=1 Tax=Pseudidiomarina sp. TaxID=2081707 RepID=UPI003A974FBD
MMIWTLPIILGGAITLDAPNTTIQQLRASELSERLAQTEAKRLQLELQIAKARHAIDGLEGKPSGSSEVASELLRYKLVGIVATGDKTHVVLRYGDELIRLLSGIAGPMELTAEVEPGRVRLKRFGHFRDLPLTERW